jgi:hypothetical protein
METVTRNVAELSADDRAALERVVGHSLSETEQAILNVVRRPSADGPSIETAGNEPPEFWNIYDGLSDQEIDDLDAAIKERADLTRVFEERNGADSSGH